MKAIYRGKLYIVDGDFADGLILGDANGDVTRVLYADPDLTIDPTDDEVTEAADNGGLVPPPLSGRQPDARARALVRDASIAADVCSEDELEEYARTGDVGIVRKADARSRGKADTRADESDRVRHWRKTGEGPY